MKMGRGAKGRGKGGRGRGTGCERGRWAETSRARHLWYAETEISIVLNERWQGRGIEREIESKRHIKRATCEGKMESCLSSCKQDFLLRRMYIDGRPFEKSKSL